MAFENQTYENIIERMLSRIRTVHPELDTREGSIIFNALAPAAAELAIGYLVLNTVLNESFVATASREYILLKCDETGIDVSVFDATAGTFKGEFDVEVPIGSRWNCELYNYTVTEQMASENGYYVYKMKCETAGTEPNSTLGSLTAITDLPTGLTHAELTECLIPGDAEYTDDAIKEYYYNFINATVSDGNVGQYERWCEDYEGIGNFKIFPLWNGANTVKVSILNAENRKASETLVEEYQKYLDPGITGMGDGVAPIGAFVTVATATEVPITVSATVLMKEGYTDTSAITTAIEKYFAQIAYEKSVVAYMNVGATILDVEGVEFVTDLLVNGGTNDIALDEEEIPIVGTTNWVVSK